MNNMFCWLEFLEKSSFEKSNSVLTVFQYPHENHRLKGKGTLDLVSWKIELFGTELFIETGRGPKNNTVLAVKGLWLSVFYKVVECQNIVNSFVYP